MRSGADQGAQDGDRDQLQPLSEPGWQGTAGQDYQRQHAWEVGYRSHCQHQQQEVTITHKLYPVSAEAVSKSVRLWQR